MLTEEEISEIINTLHTRICYLRDRHSIVISDNYDCSISALENIIYKDTLNYIEHEINTCLNIINKLDL
jgi:hypothetical protein